MQRPICSFPTSLSPPFPPFFLFSHQIFALCLKNDFKITFLSQDWPWTTQGSKLAFIVPYSDISSTLPMDCSWQSQLLNRITMKILDGNTSRTSPRIRFLCSRRDFWASQVFTVKKSKEVTSQSNLLGDFNPGPFTLCSNTIMLLILFDANVLMILEKIYSHQALTMTADWESTHLCLLHPNDYWYLDSISSYAAFKIFLFISFIYRWLGVRITEHRKNCNSLSDSISWFEYLNFQELNCVTKSLNCSQSLCLCLCLW